MLSGQILDAFKMKTALSLVLVILFLAKLSSAAYSPEKETEIRNNTVLHPDYDATSRPVDQTNIAVSLSVLAIDELDIKIQKFTTAGWLTFEWTDPRLTWDKYANDNITYIFAKPKDIWRPEVVIDNSLEDLGVIHDDELMLRIKYDGTVDWEPLILFTAHCNVDITYYPYDQQKCAIEVVSWGYNYNEIKLIHHSYHVNLEDYVENGEWRVVDTFIEDRNLTEHTPSGIYIYPQLDFWFYLDRRTDYYNLNVMMPVFMTSLLIMLVFIVPVISGEKLQYVLTVQLSLAVLLTLVTDSLPSTSVSTSILGIYLGIVLILAAVAVFLSVLILMVYHREGEPKMNSFVAMIGRFCARVTCSTLGKRVPDTVTKVVPMNKSEDENDEVVMYEVTWPDVALAINKLCFIVFMIVTLLMNFAFVILLAVGGYKYSPDVDH